VTATFTVLVEPSGARVAIEPGQTLMAAARQQGYRWPTACNGRGICTLCYVTIRSGHAHAVPPQPAEAERLAGIGLDPARQRLACHLEVDGDLTVVKRGVALRKHLAPDKRLAAESAASGPEAGGRDQ
jgi:ferredoxin